MQLPQFLTGSTGAIVGAALMYLAYTGKVKFGGLKNIAMIGGLVLLLSGLGIFALPFSTGGSSGAAVTAQTGQPLLSNNCPTTGRTSVQFRVKDSLAASLAFLPENIWIHDDTTNVMFTNVTTSSTDPGWSTATNLPCGDKFTATAVSARGASHSAVSAQFTASGSDQQVELSNAQYSNVQMRVKDVSTDSYLFGFANAATGGTNQTTYLFTNSTNYYADNTAAATAVGSNGQFVGKLLVKTNTTRQSFSDAAVKTLLCVDEGTAGAWQLPIVSINGVSLAESKATLPANDLVQTNVAASEGCYDIGQIGDAEKVIDVTAVARSGQNPTTTDDLTFYLIPQGRFRSNVDPNVIKIGAYDDSSSSTPVLYAAGAVPAVTVQIS